MQNFKHVDMILIICLLIQIADFSIVFEQCSSRIHYLLEQKYHLKDDSWDKLSDKKEIYFMYDPVGDGSKGVTMTLGKYASDNNMVMNDFYTSRKNSIEISMDRLEEQNRIFNGNPDDDKIYVFSLLPIEYAAYSTRLNIYNIDGILIGTTDELDRDKIDIANGVDLLKYTAPVISSEVEGYEDPHEHESGKEAHIYGEEYIMSLLNLPSGKYHIKYEGDNLDNGDFVVAVNDGNIRLELENYQVTDENVSFDIVLDNNYSNIIIKCENMGKGEILVTDLTISEESD